METLYGESPEIQMDDGYDANNGIALFSANSDTGGETITSSSGDQGGSQEIPGKILWSITRYSEGTGYRYEGGFTGQGWADEYFETRNETNPFTTAGWDALWTTASTEHNLDIYFAQVEYSFSLAGYLEERSAEYPGCVVGSPY